jgi:hypothetical protein
VITLPEYFGPWRDHPDATVERVSNALRLLTAVSALESFAVMDGVEFPTNPATDSGVSGQQYGGFRPQDCTEGAMHSSHKEGLAVDRYDPTNAIDNWCMANLDKLEQCGIYIEAPEATWHWSHWTIKPPGSGHRVFIP